MLPKLVRELVYVLTFLTGVNSIEHSAQEGESQTFMDLAYRPYQIQILSWSYSMRLSQTWYAFSFGLSSPYSHLQGVVPY